MISTTDLRMLFDRLNAVAFDNTLPESIELLVESGRAEGAACFEALMDGGGRIYGETISVFPEMLNKCKWTLEAVMLHEMIHAYLIIVKHDYDFKDGGHTPAFHAECARIEQLGYTVATSATPVTEAA